MIVFKKPRRKSAGGFERIKFSRAIIQLSVYFLFLQRTKASLAQLVEQRFRKAWVAGSNPVGGSSLFLDGIFGRS